VHRHNHLLCSTSSIESDYVVALERAGLPTDAFANDNSSGANVEVAHTAVILALRYRYAIVLCGFMFILAL
jgi:hypothetical protein